MTDIAERLRSFFDRMNNPPSPELPMGANVVLDAADEIERLRSELEEVKAANDLLMHEPPHGYTNMPNGTVVPYWLYPVKPTKEGTDQ